MSNERKNRLNESQKDPVKANKKEIQSPFRNQDLEGQKKATPQDEAKAEQQRKETLTERD